MCSCASPCDKKKKKKKKKKRKKNPYLNSRVTENIHIWIFGACVQRRVFCDSIRMDPEFKPRDGARGQNLGHFCKVLLCCG